MPEAGSREGRKLYRVSLSETEREELHRIACSKAAAEKRLQARILLLADEARKDGGRPDTEIWSEPEVGTTAVERVRKQCVVKGLKAAIERREQ